LTTLIPRQKLRRNADLLNKAISDRNTETDTMLNLNTIPSTNISRSLAVSASVLVLAGLLAGCGGALSNAGGTAGGGGVTVHFQGNVHGGNQPVNGAFIQLYTVGTTALQSASTPLILPSTPSIPSPVTTDVNGNFSITGTYSCTSATQVYLVATQGDPGDVGTNPNLSLAAALGDCNTLLANAATTFLQVNELTTVAAAYALAPFAHDYANIGANGANNTGLVNAFANANALISTASGAAPGTLPAGATVPVAELNTLANIIASCVNTTGAGSTQCSQLFTATGASDTFGAALAIAKKPGSAATTGLYTLSSAIAPFQPSMTGASNDFSVAINYSPGSGTFATPYGIAIDAGGNAWVTNEGGTTVTELSPAGTVLPTPATPGLVGAQGIAVDRDGSVWVANTAGNSVIKYTLTRGSVTATNTFTNGGVDAPTAIALDSAGTAWIANFNGNSVTALSNTGATIGGSPFNGGNTITVPTGIAVGIGSGAIFVTSGSGAIVKLDNAGAFQASLNDQALQGPVAVAVGNNSQVAATGFTTGSSIGGAVSEFTTDGAVGAASPVTLGLTSPAGIASDSLNFWVANSTPSGSLTRFLYGNGGPNAPLAGFGTLNTPIGVAIDSSGSVWTANSGDNTVSKFIGIASPVGTPIAVNVGP